MDAFLILAVARFFKENQTKRGFPILKTKFYHILVHKIKMFVLLQIRMFKTF